MCKYYHLVNKLVAGHSNFGYDCSKVVAVFQILKTKTSAIANFKWFYYGGHCSLTIVKKQDGGIEVDLQKEISFSIVLLDPELVHTLKQKISIRLIRSLSPRF